MSALLAPLLALAIQTPAPQTPAPQVPAPQTPVGLELSPLFSDGAVLQRGMPIRVFGAAEPGMQVDVTLAGQSVMALANGDGRWGVWLEPLEAGGPHELRANHLVVRDVLVGEVWICSGQSNMEWPLGWAADPEATVAAASDGQLRLFKVPRAAADEPRRTAAEGTDIENQPVESGWAPCAPDAARLFSAVGYHFGSELRTALDIPVGLIQCAWGGTAAEAWTEADAFSADPSLDASRLRIDLADHNRPSQLFNGMVAPLIPTAFRGVIWYQGEANAGYARDYRDLFPAMIRSWREAWARPELPFLFVQLAAFLPRHEQPTESAWAELREAQAMTLALSHTGMAVTIDIGNATDIHPKNKLDVGRRLARLARADVYREAGLVSCGPTFKEMTVGDGEVRVSFAHADGLASKGSEPTGFAVAGADRVWHWAAARIEGSDAVLSSKDVLEPVAARYAWADNPACNLYNGAGLPAVPFRTDDWPHGD
jgi:sialate O-acetylesterase